MPKLRHDESMQYGPGAGKRNDNKLKHHRSSTPLRTSPSLGVVKNQSNVETMNKEGHIIAAVANREEITKSHIDVDQQKRQSMIQIQKNMADKDRESSFFSGDGGAVIVGKIAAKLDCGSVLSQRSNNFKSLGPINLTTINLEMNNNGSRNITF